MKSLVVILKALGVKVTEADIKMLEELIPQIPGHLQMAANTINKNITNFDARLLAIEMAQERIATVMDARLDKLERSIEECLTSPLKLQ